MATYRDPVYYRKLLEDCVLILAQQRAPYFSQVDKSKPSYSVFIWPYDMSIGYWFEFWNQVAGPVLVKLAAQPTPAGGWTNATATVDSELRNSIKNSDWSRKIIY